MGLLLALILGGVSAALLVPRYVAQHPCSQARAALARLAEAEKAYFAEHKTYAAHLTYLNMERPPHIYLLILRGDSQSFLAAASHYACEKDTKGTPNVYMWDSARLEATLSIWSVLIRSSVVMANQISFSGSRQGEDGLGALKEPPRLRK